MRPDVDAGLRTRNTTYYVKQRVVEAAVKLMRAASINVEEEHLADNTISLRLHLPRDSDDRIGDLMTEALEARNEQAT